MRWEASLDAAGRVEAAWRAILLIDRENSYGALCKSRKNEHVERNIGTGTGHYMGQLHSPHSYITPM